MKPRYLLFSILIAFVACTKENLVINTPSSQGDNTDIEVNITIARADDFASTKATVKNAFADDDVVFVFFKGIAAPKYLEIKYNSSTDTWTSTAKNGLTSSDLSDAADKKMTAIYLPYGSTATVAASEGNFIFSDITYSGYFLNAELVTYTYDGDVLSGTLNMTAPALSNGSDKLIHFDISGFTSGHDYKLYQDYVKPLTFTSVSADGVLTLDEGTVGASIPGYEDGSMMSFSGILDASAVGNAVDYQFSIDDLTSSILYTRDAGTKTLSTSKYIGIGAINNDAVWNAFEYVDLGLSVKWATHNLGAEHPENSGDLYAWGEIETKQSYTWSDYKYCNDSYKSLTKYCTNGLYGDNDFADYKVCLEPIDDVAHKEWKGNWRIPSMQEFEELCNTSNCNWEYTPINGVWCYMVTSRKKGYEGKSIIIPTTRTMYTEEGFYSSAYYWSSSVSSNTRQPFIAYALGIEIDTEDDGWGIGTHERYNSFSIRPVISHSKDSNENPEYSVYLDKEEVYLKNDEKISLKATVTKNGSVSDDVISWTSNNTLVATVNENGEITIKRNGTVTITASCQGKSASCKLYVGNYDNGFYKYVDLGLSVKWATVNVGALKPESYGDYYAWGETEPYYESGYAQEKPQTHWKDGKSNGYSWSSYKWCGGSYNTLTKYNNKTSYDIYGNYYDGKNTLDIEDDVANVKWGGSWRLPTPAELDELIENCTWTWTTVNGINGHMLTSNKVGFTDRSIFLPAAGCRYDTSLDYVGSDGYYWSSWISSNVPSVGWSMDFNSHNGVTVNWDRCNGYSVRPVCP